ncbi:aquaporin Z [Rhizobiales bacterium GAS113]|nr:aquaporin Z [Rhizobiales bacterium GAS113]
MQIMMLAPLPKEDIIVNKYIAELFGTAVLVLVGCGSVVLSGFGPTFPMGILPVGLAFGLAVTAMAYGIGPISGCHINPAVTLGVWAAGRMPASDVVGYIISQIIGAIIGASLLYVLATGKLAGYDLAKGGLGANGWGEDYLGAYGTGAAVLAEFLATLIFIVVILGVTQKNGGQPATAGLAIGLTLFILHLAFINVTGLSVNPARSLGPAVFVGGHALSQLWLFLIVPSVAGLCAGFLFKAKLFEA